MQPQPEYHLEPARVNDVDPDAPERRALMIVVTYNSFDDLPDVVASIRRFVADHPRNHVIVVENSADSRVRDYVESSEPSARVGFLVIARPRPGQRAIGGSSAKDRACR